jgi:TolA-binding protein
MSRYRGRAAWRRGWAFGAVLALAALCVAPSRARAQASPRELQEEARIKMSTGDFMGAIPPLQQLIQLLGESANPQTVAGLEMTYYNVALCQFFTGSFQQAQEGFDTYLKKYKRAMKRQDALVYRADSMRLKNDLENAIKAYKDVLRQYQFSDDMLTDIHCSIARCHLAQDRWKEAMDSLMVVYRKSPDFLRRNWAATLLTTAYLKERDLDHIYALVPFLLQPDSLASRSVAFNLAALEAADNLFAEEFYRDALWVYRLVYPHDTVMVRGEEYLDRLREQAERIKHMPSNPRELMRVQENIGELEAELEALRGVDNYDLELHHRIAMGYMEMMRYREGREIFLYLHRTAEGRMAEEALFLAFRCSSFIQPWTRAFELGEQYIRKYPSGEFFDLLTLAMGQMYAKLQDWPAVIRHLTRTLEMSPKHQSAADCMFLLGYASFMEEKFEDAIRWLTDMNSKFPGNALEDEGVYWMGMSYLFNRQYEEAGKEFDRLLERYPNSTYVVDAGFRRAICDYGLARYEESDKRLASFVEAYPTNVLTGEAIMMRGDIAGTLGRLGDAVTHYQRAMGYDVNIEFYNHCAFQAGRVLSDAEQYDRLRSHFQSYLERNREGSNIPMAVYWVGVGLWNGGEEKGALRYYREAVEKHGKDRAALGIDLILDEWMGRIKRSRAEDAVAAWQELHSAEEKAVSDANEVMALRYQRILLYDQNLQPSKRQRILQRFATEGVLESASPAVLQTMLDMAQKDGRTNFAVKVAQYVVEKFPETDYALDARMTLARQFLTLSASADAAQAHTYRQEAVKHLEVISEVYAASSEAAMSLLLQGQIHRDEQEWPKADECYKSVLGVKEWRNVWPEALHGRGECAFSQKQYEQASAYFERIYVMYGHYAAWTAKAYLRRAECLRRLYQVGKAKEVLSEMLKNGDLAALPEAEEAKQLMEKLGQSS